MSAATIMIQGTSSNAGKSALTTAVCRVLRSGGLSVCPFKPQNMSNNSAVTADGGEIGRAQALQALACDLEPLVDMNPILLKPGTTTGAQLIVQGKVIGNFDARSYHQKKPDMMKFVLESYRRLAARFDVIVVEGAGSPAEINLRTGDIANMGFAEAVQCPVVLVADIDRGGVFAQLIGTMELLSPKERDLVRAFVINRFRGDSTLLDSGIAWLHQRSGKPTIGIVPYIENLHLDAEDGLSAKTSGKPRSTERARLKVVVPRFPRMSNQTDFDPLLCRDDVEIQFAERPDSADLIILPGSKSVYHDLSWLRRNGWETAIKRHLRYGGRLMGICGGFQMLGNRIVDEVAMESDVETFAGLGLMEFETRFQREKELKRVSGELLLNGGAVCGYEIHLGKSSGPALDAPLIKLQSAGDSTYFDGAISNDRQIIGTYVHGLFDSRQGCTALLSWAGNQRECDESEDYAAVRQRNIELIASVARQHLDFDFLERLLFKNSTDVFDREVSIKRRLRI